MDFDYDSNKIVRSRGPSSIIELECAYLKNTKSRPALPGISMNWHSASRTSLAGPSVPGTTRANHNTSAKSRNEMEELGETLEHLTAEYGKANGVAVDENACPEKPVDIRVHRNPHLRSLCQSISETIRPVPYRYVTLNFRVMRRNASMYIGNLLSQRNLRRSDLYKLEYLPIWTHCIRVRVRTNVKIGHIFHGIKSRLGLVSASGLHFCLDGFFGMEAFGDAFGNVGSDICPWMELSNNGSANSLHLRDGDNIYVSMATEGMRHLAQQCQFRASRRHSVAGNAVILGQGKPSGQAQGQGKNQDSFASFPL